MMLDRAAFFDRFWTESEAAGYRSVILHSWKNLPERIDSDIDFAVTDISPLALQRWLVGFSEKHGWRLVQVIEHEPRALYMVCIQAEEPFAALALDVAWDYRRLGHVLVPSDVLMKGRRSAEGKSFQVPAPGAEFCYVLAKSAAKGKAFGEVEERLAELLEEDYEGCLGTAEEVFENPFPLRSSERAPLVELAAWFERAECFCGVRRGKRYGFEEILMYLRRIFRPTGACFELPKRSRKEAASLRLGEILAPLFRQVELVGPISIAGMPSAWLKTVRTRGICEFSGEGGLSFPGKKVIRDNVNPAEEIICFLAMRLRGRLGLAGSQVDASPNL